MLTPETVLQNRYHVIRLLAHGGMGAVYEARDERLSTTVALKETFFAEDEMRKAFKHEASLLATLRHQALPKVFDHFSEGNGQFLVMEFIPGDDLGALLARRNAPFAPADVVNWGLQTLHALEYLHSHQPPIIHRDIKPQNMKITARGEVVLLDFGLAKGASTTSPISRSVKGYTLRYAPLEQIRGLGTDPRSDIYSLSATLYHLMTNVAPPDALGRVSALVGNEPDPLIPADQINPIIPPMIARILHASMSQDREKRPPNAAAMRGALVSAMSDSSSAKTSVAGSNATNTIISADTQRMTQAATAPQAAFNSAAPTQRSGASSAQMVQPSQPGPPSASYSAQPSTSRRKALIIGVAALIVAVIAVLAIVLILSLRKPEAGTAMDGGIASTDEKNPTPLTSHNILCGSSDAPAHYFSFDAKRGALTVMLNVIANGSTVTVELLDSKAGDVRFENGSSSLSLASTGHNEETKARVLIERDQPLLMKVSTSFPKDVQVYRVRLKGEIGLASGAFGGSSKIPAALHTLLVDRDNPNPLVSTEVLSGGTEKDLYYGFSAGPGQLNLTLDVLANGSTAEVDLFDDESNQLRFDSGSTLSIASTGHIEQANGSTVLGKKQTLLLRLSNSFPNDMRAMRVRFSGPIAGISEAAKRDSVESALNQYFAIRDEPNKLNSSEIAGRVSAKDNYYSFVAGPGKVKFKLEASGSGAEIAIEVLDADLKHVRFENNSYVFTLSAGSNEPNNGFSEIDLPSQQKVLMRISCNYPDDLRSFRLKLDGAIKLE